MNTGLFLKLYVPQYRGMGAALCTGEWGLPTPGASSHPGYKISSLGGRWCVQEPGLGAVVLVQGSAGCSCARRQVDLPQEFVSSPRNHVAAFDLPMFCLAGQYIVSFHSPRGCADSGMGWLSQPS